MTTAAIGTELTKMKAMRIGSYRGRTDVQRERPRGPILTHLGSQTAQILTSCGLRWELGKAGVHNGGTVLRSVILRGYHVWDWPSKSESWRI